MRQKIDWVYFSTHAWTTLPFYVIIPVAIKNTETDISAFSIGLTLHRRIVRKLVKAEGN